ncbi:hypothetical protein [Streptomyces sp. NPDC007991]|uniref:hypothetical protein n=1 Tax=Streptomyces sp. NPDC007991 TaxID=3364803 RepID=UPI0036E3BF08
MAVTESTVDERDLQWGYVLGEAGIEVLSLLHEDNGPVVIRATNPLTVFNDHPAAWASLGPPPPVRATRSTPPPNGSRRSPGETWPRPATRR